MEFDSPAAHEWRMTPLPALTSEPTRSNLTFDQPSQSKYGPLNMTDLHKVRLQCQDGHPVSYHFDFSTPRRDADVGLVEIALMVCGIWDNLYGCCYCRYLHQQILQRFELKPDNLPDRARLPERALSPEEEDRLQAIEETGSVKVVGQGQARTTTSHAKAPPDITQD